MAQRVNRRRCLYRLFTDVSVFNEGYTMAAREMQPGEEITADYSSFEKDFEKYSEVLN